MTINLSKSNFFDTLVNIIEEDTLLLINSSDIYEGVSGNDLCDWDILIKDDNGLLTQPNEQQYYSSAYFSDFYQKVDEGDEDEETEYLDCDFDNEKIAARKLHEIPADILQSFVDVEHGINTDEISITDAEIIEGTVYEAPNYTPQDYPSQCYEDAFMFVDNQGNKRYIKRTSPFYSDESRDIFDEITEKEFNEFC